MVISGEESWPWEGRRVGISRFVTASCEPFTPHHASASPWPLPVISYPGEPGWMVGIEVDKHHLISTALHSLWGKSSRRVWFLAHRRPTPCDCKGSPAVLRGNVRCRCIWTAGTFLLLRHYLERKSSSGQDRWVWWGGTAGSGGPQKRESNLFSPYPRNPLFWWALQVGPE